jgi:hypothetical protein
MHKTKFPDVQVNGWMEQFLIIKSFAMYINCASQDELSILLFIQKGTDKQDMINAYKILGDLGLEWRVILKWILEN